MSKAWKQIEFSAYWRNAQSRRRRYGVHPYCYVREVVLGVSMTQRFGDSALSQPIVWIRNLFPTNQLLTQTFSWICLDKGEITLLWVRKDHSETQFGQGPGRITLFKTIPRLASSIHFFDNISAAGLPMEGEGRSRCRVRRQRLMLIVVCCGCVVVWLCCARVVLFTHFVE